MRAKAWDPMKDRSASRPSSSEASAVETKIVQNVWAVYRTAAVYNAAAELVHFPVKQHSHYATDEHKPPKVP